MENEQEQIEQIEKIQQIEAVQRMQDYIYANLNSEITADDLSKAARYSPWHAYRLFVRYTEMSPADYIRRLRLSRSALRLRDDKVKIIDAAFDAGFGSVDGYQRAFLREFGCNPRQYSKNPIPICLFIPYGVKYNYTEKENEMENSNTQTVFVQVIEKPARSVIIKRGVKADEYWDYCKEVGCDVWGILISMKSLCGEPVCLWLPDKYIKPGTSKYVQGVEVETGYKGAIPDGFDIIDLPACRYTVFRGERFEEKDFCEAIEHVKSAIDKYDPSFFGLKWDTENPRIQLEPIGTRGYIELLPVKDL